MGNFEKEDLIYILDLKTQGKSLREISNIMGCGKSTVGDFLQKITYKDFWDNLSEDDKPVAYGELKEPEHKRLSGEARKFVISCVQNNTHVHQDFLDTLKVYAKENNAEILFSTFTYNKNGFQNSVKSDSNIWYDPQVREFICNDSLRLADDLIFCGELNILPTAVRPLSGFNNYTGLSSAIVPHVKVQLESVPTPKHEPVKMLYTTGTVTQRNYIEKKSGQIASWHHVYGALVVEIDEHGNWFVRQLIADSETGSFYDLNKLYTKDGVFNEDNILAINYGDVHVAKLDQDVADLSWRSEDSIKSTLKPMFQFVHDVFDHQSRNHHNTNNPHIQFMLYHNGVDSVDEEIKETTEELYRMSSRDSKLIIVDSNHDRALERWLREADYRKDPTNAMVFLKLQLAKYESMMNHDEDFHVFGYAIKEKQKELDLKDMDIKFLGLDESFRLLDIEFGQHGDMGNNGARGSVRAFDMQGIKHNIGHSHSTSIFNGVYVAGVSGKLEMGYNSGGSSWSHSHILTYLNGKRTILTLKKCRVTGRMRWRA